MTLKRSLACLAVLAFAALAAASAVSGASTFHLGAVTLGFAQTARLHVVNPEGGSVDVELRFFDAANVTLASATATLLPGQTKTLDLQAAEPGDLVLATVVATNAVSPSLCRPVVTLQILDLHGLRNLRSNSAIVSAVPVGRPLGGGEPAAVSALRTLAQAQRQFFEQARATQGRGVYAASVGELVQAGLIPQGFAVPGYELKFGTGLYLYEITATPGQKSGGRYFFVDESGVIRFPVDHCQDAPVGGQPIGG